jgi:hypothetical protein
MNTNDHWFYSSAGRQAQMLIIAVPAKAFDLLAGKTRGSLLTLWGSEYLNLKY